MNRTIGVWTTGIGVALLIGLAAGAPAAAQAPVQTADLVKRGLTAANFPRLIKLAENIYGYEAVHVQGAITTNSLIVVTRDGVVVVDGQGTEAQVARLVEDVRTLTAQPIRYVVVGSNHGDHTNGNAAFPSTVTFIGHPASQAALQRAAGQPARQGGPTRVVVPSEVVSDRRTLTLGGTELQILFLGRSHTGGDLVVYLPASKVLFMSETYLHRMFPSVAGGYPSEWLMAIDKALAMDVSVYVPGHGFIDDAKTLRDELVTFRRALETVRAEGRRLKAAGVPAEEAASKANLGEFSDWTVRDAMAGSALRRVYAEVDGELK